MTNSSYTIKNDENVVIVIGATTNSLYCQSFKITYEETVADNRTAVNLTGFTATSTTLIKGNTTETTITNNQSSWTAAYTYESSDQNVATVSNDGVITAVGKGTATITASLNIPNDDTTWKKGSTASKSIEITVNNPSHNYTFYSNGTEVSSGSCEEGAAITFPSSIPADINGKAFVGWAEAEIDGTTNTAPTFVTSGTMGNNDKNYYAVFATAEDSGSSTETASVNISEYATTNSWQGNGAVAYKSITLDKNITVSTTGTVNNGKYYSDWRLYQNGDGNIIITAKSGYTLKSAKITFSVSNTGTLNYNNNKIDSGATVTLTGKTTASFEVGNSGTATNGQVKVTAIEVVYSGSSTTYSNYCTTVVSKTLSSISVKTAPTKTTYTEDEKFDPAGLVITAIYDDDSTEDVAYDEHSAEFTFVPSLTTALTPSNNEVTIIYKEKTCTQSITVNAIPTYTLTITQPADGGTLTVKNGDVTLENGATVRVGTNLTCEVTNIPDGKRFSRFYAKWGEGDGESKYKMNNPATFDNIATENISACEIYVTYKDIQYYTINYMINGVNTDPQENLEEKTALTFPTAPATIADKSFIGWVENEINEPVDEEPTLVNTSKQTATANKTFYAVYAAQGEGGAATYTKATTLAVDDKVVLGLGEVNGKPEQAVTGYESSSATISSTEDDWMIFTAVEYEEKGIVLKNDDDNYVKAGSSKFELGTDNPSTISTNANSEVLGYSFVLAQNGTINRFYSNPSLNNYPTFKMWKVEGGITYSDFTTAPLGTGSITVSAGGYDTPTEAYYATYYTDHCVTVPEGCEAASVNVEDNKMYLSYTWTAGKIIPANTGVVIKAHAAGTYTYHIGAQEDATPVEGTNYLTGSTSAGTTVAPGAGDYKFYKLAKATDSATIGFYWGAADGAAFSSGANKAYLAVPAETASQIKGFAFGEADDATAIFDVTTDTHADNTLYNLNGQRVSKAQKGIYIVNGKKVMFK